MKLNLPRPLIALLIVLGFWLLAVVFPLEMAVQHAQQAQGAAEQGWVTAVTQVDALERARLAPHPVAPPLGQSLDITVRDALATVQISADKVETLGGGTVRLQLSQVPGDQMIRLLFRFQALGLTLQQWDMKDLQQQGVWSGSGVLAGP